MTIRIWSLHAVFRMFYPSDFQSFITHPIICFPLICKSGVLVLRRVLVRLKLTNRWESHLRIAKCSEANFFAIIFYCHVLSEASDVANLKMEPARPSLPSVQTGWFSPHISQHPLRPQGPSLGSKSFFCAQEKELPNLYLCQQRFSFTLWYLWPWVPSSQFSPLLTLAVMFTLRQYLFTWKKVLNVTHFSTSFIISYRVFLFNEIFKELQKIIF